MERQWREPGNEVGKNQKNICPGGVWGLDAWMLFTQGRCVNEPLYMFTCITLLLALSTVRSVPALGLFVVKGGQVSKETVVLRQWEYYKVIWFYQLGLYCELASESLYGGQFTLSTQLIKPNCLWLVSLHFACG